MKIIRYIDVNGTIQYGGCTNGRDYFEMEGDIYHYELTSRPARIQKILSPIVPTNIICIGLNYRKHAEESNMPIPEWPVVFLKSSNAVQHPGDPIVLPRMLESKEVDYECELAVIIGKHCKNATVENALEFVLGYTCANDVSARDWQIKKGGGQWCRGKLFDTFAPLGPCIVTSDEITDPNTLEISTTVNGETRQHGNTEDMIFNVKKLITFLSGSVTLEPGTVILTGTPKGVGMSFNPPRWLKKGDEVTIEIKGIGKLSNPVIEEPVV